MWSMPAHVALGDKKTKVTPQDGDLGIGFPCNVVDMWRPGKVFRDGNTQILGLVDLPKDEPP